MPTTRYTLLTRLSGARQTLVAGTAVKGEFLDLAMAGIKIFIEES